MRRWLVLLLIPVFASTLLAAEKPNILWITSEDNAFHWLGCYGNEQVKTPRLDAMADAGVRFRYAYSNAPVCAVARSTILNGVYAPTQGTQHMRSRYRIPESYLPYVYHLRKAGYYCSNRSKTDYNFKGNDGAIWDECSRKAHYRKRKEGQPFFSIFNLTTSHESSLFGGKLKSIGKPRLSQEEVQVPPYLPDLPEIRHDLAIYHDVMERLDSQIGDILDQLKEDGLADDTIVFYYSDHGGVLPRGKRYLKDTGVRVPMIVHVPEKWRHLSPFSSGTVQDELVAFVDLAPTLLSLAGLTTPPQMQGRAFLGKHRKEPEADSTVFLYADRFDEILSGMRRGITTGRWKYIRRFYPHMAAAPYSFYQFGQQGWTGWRKAWKSGKLPDRFNRIWETPQAVEELYDTENDPWEINNLADNPEFAGQLATMRDQLRARMISVRDSSVIPEPLFGKLSGGKPLAKVLQSMADDLPGLVSLMFAASSGDVENLELFRAKLSSEDLLTRYWATVGCLVLGKEAEPAAGQLEEMTKLPDATLRIAAAHALARMGHDGVGPIVEELEKDLPEIVCAYALSALFHLDATDRIPEERLRKMVDSKMNYGSRFAGEILKMNSDAK